ncbi:MAG: MFS transporter [Phycisphaerae bacterium]
MSTALQSQRRLPSLLIVNRNFVLLWAAYGISAVGDHLSEMALLFERQAMEGLKATRIQALLTFGFFLPFVLVAPLAGWWADRFSRKWTMIASDLIRAAVMINLAWLVPALAGLLVPYGLGDFSVVIPLACVGVFAAFFSPARQAMLPTLIRQDHLVRANALISALGTIATILSAVIGGYLVKYAGARWNYRLDALTFVLSALLLAFIAMSQARVVPHAKLTGVWRPVIEGFRYVRQHRRVLQLILLGAVFWAAAGIVISVVPALVRDVFGGDISHAGLYRGLLGIGLAAGAAVMTIVGPAMPLKLRVLVGLAGGGFWVLALDAAYVLKLGKVFTGLCLIGIGGAGAALLVTIMASLQRFVPDSRRGRVFGVSDMTTMTAMVLATGLLGLPNIPNLDAYVPYLLGFTGLGLGTVLWLTWRGYRRNETVSPFLSLLWKLGCFYAHFWCRLRRDGICTIPREGPVILAANHTAGIDPIVIQTTTLHRLIGFVVAQEYYERPIAGWLMRQVGCVPIDRENPGKSFLSASLRKLRAGGCLGIFPQGTYAPPDQTQPEVKYGVGVLALRTGAPIVPCHISGTSYRENPFAAFFIRHSVRIKYGPPIDLAEFRGREKDRVAAQQVSELIMSKINELGASDERIASHKGSCSTR